MQKTERLVAITLLLQARGKMTAQRLSDILGVSTRTIYRDIMALSLAHVPVSMDIGPGGGYYLPENYHLESAIFNREEAIALVLSADMSGSYNLFANDSTLHRALVKLEAVLPEEYRADVKQARKRILFDTSEWCNRPMAPTFLETLRLALLSQRQVDLLYSANSCCEEPENDRSFWRRVEPMGLVLKGLPMRHARGGIWYLVAFCHSCQRVNTFRISLIEQLCPCSEIVEERPEFHLRTYWREARKQLDSPRISIKLRVTAALRSKLKGSISLVREESDGSAIVRIEQGSFDEALTYVLGLGADAIVLCPSTLRETIAKTAQAMATLYESHPHRIAQ